jgi:hypothetical protein
MMWAKEISEGAHVGATTHQGAPGGAGAPWCLVGTRCTPLWYYLHQKFRNNWKKSYQIFRTFRELLFLGHFFIARIIQKIG